jgi:Bromodomain
VKLGFSCGVQIFPTGNCSDKVASCAGKSGVLQTWVPAALAAVDQISKMELATEFRQPVPKSLTWYHDIIKKPMDLGTVSSKLSRGIYQSLAELQADVQRIWDNCRQFNEPDSEIAIAGNQLRDYWRRIGSNDVLLAASSGPGSVSGGSGGAPAAHQRVEGSTAASGAGTRAGWPSDNAADQGMMRQAQAQQHHGMVQDGRGGVAMGRPGMPTQGASHQMRWTGVPDQAAMAPAHVRIILPPIIILVTTQHSASPYYTN